MVNSWLYKDVYIIVLFKPSVEKDVEITVSTSEITILNNKNKLFQKALFINKIHSTQVN